MQRKVLLLAPLAAIPLLCLIFYGMGGGKGMAKADNTATTKGFNSTLPMPRTDPAGQTDKMGFYDKAGKDSVKLSEERRRDPFYQRDTTTHHTQPVGVMNLPGRQNPDASADKVLAQLQQLQQTLHEPNTNNAGNNAIPLQDSKGTPAVPDMQRVIQKLQKQAGEDPPDPELAKMDGMLDKILRIQHPEQFSDSVKANPKSLDSVYRLTKERDDPSVTPSVQAAFYYIGEDEHPDSSVTNTISAVVEGDQTLVAGATIALRLTESAVLHKTAIPKGTLVYGMVSLAGDRLKVLVSSIRVQNAICPVSLTAYDQDGLPGIKVPGAIGRDAAKESADQAIGTVGGTTSLDPSFGAQAASAGIQAARTFLSRKVRLVRVSVKSGYRVLLRNDH